jgi:phage shock protein A
LVEQYQDDILQLENKLAMAQEKQRLLVQRHRHAQQKQRAQREIRRFDSTEAVMRFEQFENRIERMEAEADLVNYGRQPRLEDEFALLEGDEDIERELQALKTAGTRRPTDTPSA